MTQRAWAYVWGVLAVGLVLSGISILTSTITTEALLPFVGLTLLAILSQLFEAEIPGRQSYYPHIVFFFAGMLLLPPAYFVGLVILPHVFEWVKERLVCGPHLQAWYIQPFNIAGHIIAGTAAYWSYHAIGADPLTSYTLPSVLAVTVAVVVYVLVNHLLVGAALVLARGLSWRNSGVLGVDSLVSDLITASLGYIAAVLVALSPWLALPVLSQLVLVYWMLMMFRRKHENLIDGQTGLWTAKHFNNIFSAEMDRAKRFNRYLTVVVADLDTPDALKSSYGRLATNTVLAGVGKALRKSVRQYDVAARIDDQRFAVVLPETNPFEALIVAERLRTAVEDASFEVETSKDPVRATISLGVACFPGDGVEFEQLLEAAGKAARHAEFKGRNRVVCFADVPPDTSEREKEGGLKLKGEIYAPTPEKAGFANAALRTPRR